MTPSQTEIIPYADMLDVIFYPDETLGKLYLEARDRGLWERVSSDEIKHAEDLRLPRCLKVIGTTLY